MKNKIFLCALALVITTNICSVEDDNIFNWDSDFNISIFSDHQVTKDFDSMGGALFAASQLPQNGKSHCCKKCLSLFATLQNLDHHMNDVHTKATNFTCKQCDAHFKNQHIVKNPHKLLLFFWF